MNYTGSDHTFVVCAYKDSQFLYTCIESLLKQSVKSSIIIATSTPSDNIKKAAAHFSLPLFVNTGEKGIAADWNFGYSKAQTRLVTLAHQDDVYYEGYLENALEHLNKASKPLIFFSDYLELRGEKSVGDNTNLKIKRLMLFPLRFNWARKARWIRRAVLSLGCPIGCPTVTFVRENLPFPLFDKAFLCDLDWAAWERLSKLTGDFVYYPGALMQHRIYSGSTTTKIINDHKRIEEDLQILYRFWPKAVARQIEKFYCKSEKSNQL